MSRCRTCGAEILWVEMLDTGKKMPVDLPLQTVVVVNSDKTQGAVRQAASSHFATCPQASEHRRTS